jgi:probable HAF family extracellular repeat protein
MSHFKLSALALFIGLAMGVGFTPIANAETYTLTILNRLPGATTSAARGINNAGQVVGYSLSSGGFEQAVIWNGTTPTVLNGLPGATDSFANAINNAGQVVGSSYTSGGGEAVIWNGTTPIPEPSSYAMLLAGLGLIGFIAYRRKNDSYNMPMAT